MTNNKPVFTTHQEHEECSFGQRQVFSPKCFFFVFPLHCARCFRFHPFWVSRTKITNTITTPQSSRPSGHVVFASLCEKRRQVVEPLRASHLPVTVNESGTGSLHSCMCIRHMYVGLTQNELNDVKALGAILFCRGKRGDGRIDQSEPVLTKSLICPLPQIVLCGCHVLLNPIQERRNFANPPPVQA